MLSLTSRTSAEVLRSDNAVHVHVLRQRSIIGRS